MDTLVTSSGNFYPFEYPKKITYPHVAKSMLAEYDGWFYIVDPIKKDGSYIQINNRYINYIDSVGNLVWTTGNTWIEHNNLDLRRDYSFFYEQNGVTYLLTGARNVDNYYLPIKVSMTDGTITRGGIFSGLYPRAIYEQDGVLKIVATDSQVDYIYELDRDTLTASSERVAKRLPNNSVPFLNNQAEIASLSLDSAYTGNTNGSYAIELTLLLNVLVDNMLVPLKFFVPYDPRLPLVERPIIQISSDTLMLQNVAGIGGHDCHVYWDLASMDKWVGDMIKYNTGVDYAITY